MCGYRFLYLLFIALAMPAAAFGQSSTGPIKLNPKNSHWFQYDGKATALITCGEHYGAVINLDFDYKKYLQTLKASGLNYTRIFTGSFVEPAGAHGIEQNTLAPANGRFLAPWARSDVDGYIGGGHKFDLTRFNPLYLERLHDFMRTAKENGIIVELTFFSSTYNDKIWRYSPLHPENNIQSYAVGDWKTNNTTDNTPEIMQVQEDLVGWLVRELNSYDNLFFEIQNEPWADNHVMGGMINPYILEKRKWPNAVEITTKSSVDWQRRIIKKIRTEEKSLPKRHLVAQNVANFRLALRETDLVGADIVNFHYAYPEAVRWNYGLDRPIGFDETGFAGTADQTYRRQAWNFVFSGGALFNHLDYSFAVGREDGRKSLGGSPGGGSRELRSQIGILAKFVHSFKLEQLRPIDDLIVHAPGVVARVLGTEGLQYAVYLEGRGPSNLKLKLPAGDWRLEWMSVVSGEVIAENSVTTVGKEIQISSPDFESEVALRIVAR